MATTSSVLKPDFGAKRKHFIFTDEHEQLRESIRSFAQKELAPHADEWEETTFPDSVFPRMGELGFLGLDKPTAVSIPEGESATAKADAAPAAVSPAAKVETAPAPLTPSAKTSAAPKAPAK